MIAHITSHRRTAILLVLNQNVIHSTFHDCLPLKNLPCSRDIELWFRTDMGFVVSFLSSYILIV